ncbi:MAG: TIGR02677 family protein [Bacilli bacterium]|nr:TIGR02677 family protein [Bacilli bacterium]
MLVTEKIVKQITEVKYLSVENTERYRPIIRYFFKQYEKLEYWLYKEDVFNALRENDIFNDYTLELCEQDLLKLTEWGNLTNIQDTSNVQTVEEFKNRKYRYQLSEYAIEIERMVMRLETLNIETASLEPKLFEKIKILLTKIKDIDDLTEINDCFEELNETFTKLNNNYKDFLKMFHEVKNEELMKSEQFLIYKDRVIEYLKNFLSGFQLNTLKIKQLLNDYPNDFEDTLISKIMEYKRNQPILEPNFDYNYLEEVLRGKWKSIIKWFTDARYEESETERLRRAINNIINKITKSVMSIIESNTSVNRMEEYKHILKLFLNVNDVYELEQYVPVIFGIHKVKHFTGISKGTDSITIKPSESEHVFLDLKSHSRLIKEKTVKVQVENKLFEKERQLKEILAIQERQKQLLKKYIDKGEIMVSEVKNIESFERRFILSLLTMGINKGIVKNNEFNILYSVEKINDDIVELVSVDGTLTLNNYRIVFIGDNNGV